MKLLDSKNKIFMHLKNCDTIEKSIQGKIFFFFFKKVSKFYVILFKELMDILVYSIEIDDITLFMETISLIGEIYTMFGDYKSSINTFNILVINKNTLSFFFYKKKKKKKRDN